MNHSEITKQLARNKDVFKALLSQIQEDEYTWKQSPDKWCLLEIVCHLYDEEIEDFRARTKHTLETPGEPLPSIDPQGWVLERKYMQQDYNRKLNDFLAEREHSIAWLLTLHNPNWENAYQHPKFGAMSAKMFLCNWLAHDYLHIRQITRLKFDHLKSISGEPLNYAGEW